MKKYLLIFFLLLTISVLTASLVLAADKETTGPEVVKLINPIGGSEANPTGEVDFYKILGGIIRYVMGFLGGLTLLVFMIGGFMWLTSAGNDEQVKKGTQTMVWAVIGIFIVFSSYAILNLVITGLTTDDGSSSANSIQNRCTSKGEGWACMNIEKCTADFSAANGDLTKKREMCETAKTCEIGICPGGNEIVCCIGKGGVKQLPEAGAKEESPAAGLEITGTCMKLDEATGDAKCATFIFPQGCDKARSPYGGYCQWENETVESCKKDGDDYGSDGTACKGRCGYDGSKCEGAPVNVCWANYCKLNK